MTYKYFSLHESEEHMLYIDEIIKIFSVYSKNNKFHNKFLDAYITQWAKDNIEDYQQLYYINKFGNHKKVFSEKIYIPAIKNLLKILKETNIYYDIEINGIIYTVRR